MLHAKDLGNASLVSTIYSKASSLCLFCLTLASTDTSQGVHLPASSPIINSSGIRRRCSDLVFSIQIEAASLASCLDNGIVTIHLRSLSTGMGSSRHLRGNSSGMLTSLSSDRQSRLYRLNFFRPFQASLQNHGALRDLSSSGSGTPVTFLSPLPAYRQRYLRLQKYDRRRTELTMCRPLYPHS
jgi:hypothetical protein